MECAMIVLTRSIFLRIKGVKQGENGELGKISSMSLQSKKSLKRKMIDTTLIDRLKVLADKERKIKGYKRRLRIKGKVISNMTKMSGNTPRFSSSCNTYCISFSRITSK